jgi:hypothetical protein
VIVHNVEQGTAEWFRVRLGIPTASNFDKIVTPTGQLSKQSRGYAFRLVTEILLQKSLEPLSNLEWVERGKELEPDAVRMYEFETEMKTAPVGFITTDDRQIGCSPDRLLIGESGGVEIKCPAPHTHVEYMLDGFGKDYIVQVQGQMLVGEFEFVDRYSYHPEMPPFRHRTVRDEAFIRKLEVALEDFNEMKLEMLLKARERGLFAERTSVTAPMETAYSDAYGLGSAAA